MQETASKRNSGTEMEPQFFARAADLREWFEDHHLVEKELLVGYYKTGTGKESITWPESVDGG